MSIGEGRAVRRYNRSVLLLSILYAAGLVTAIYLFRHAPPSGPIAYALGILPALPIIGVFAALGRYLIEEPDEYVRMVTVRQSLIASGFLLSIATAWGFLESFGLLPHVHAYYAAVLWFAGQGLGACVNRVLARGDGA